MIMYNFINNTLSQIVTDHYQTARVFENYGLDYCCHGKRYLSSACTEKNIPLETILNDLNSAVILSDSSSEFNQMSLTELAEYIVRVHHSYVKLNLPQISEYISRVVSKHGENFPFMKEVQLLFIDLSKEFEQHLLKEEKILFPKIKLLELKVAENVNPGYLEEPIIMMEEEHDHAGATMQKIRALTNNYAIPGEACTTFRLTLEALNAFEEDLHLHVHLENNILFPKALQQFVHSSCDVTF